MGFHGGCTRTCTSSGEADPLEIDSRRHLVLGWQQNWILSEQVTYGAKLNQGEWPFRTLRACNISKTWSSEGDSGPSVHLLLFPSIELGLVHDRILPVLAVQESFVCTRGHLKTVNSALLPHLGSGPSNRV